jgi:hypothetical protein
MPSPKSYQEYLLIISDDIDETDLSQDNDWGQFTNIELQTYTRFRDITNLSFNNIKKTALDILEPIKEISSVTSISRINTIEHLQDIQQIPQIQKTYHRDRGCHTKPPVKHIMLPRIEDYNIKTQSSYTFISVTGMLLCVCIFINFVP